MGQYDSIDVSDNKLGIPYTDTRPYYQTHDLGRSLYTYSLNSDNQLIPVTRGEVQGQPLEYKGEMEISGSVPDRGTFMMFTYLLTFENNRIVKVVKVSEIELKPSENVMALLSRLSKSQ